jgi:hypothetical protein
VEKIKPGQGKATEEWRPSSWLSLLPRRNFRRAFFLLLILLAVLAIKRSGGLRLGTIFDAMAPPATLAPSSEGPAYHLHVVPAKPGSP